MAQTGVVSWSQTAATNATADSNVNWAEGMAPSQVNDSARAVMASVAKWRDDNYGLGSAGGPTNYTWSSFQVFSSLAAMNLATITVYFNVTNAVNPTLNVDSLGAKPITLTDNADGLPAGFIVAGSTHRLTYDNNAGAFYIHVASVASFIPPGAMIQYVATSAPSGWLLCDGTGYSQTTYANLFAIIGTTYGSTGAGMFSVPDLRARVPVGYDAGSGSGRMAGLHAGNITGAASSLGNTGGEENHTLSTAELPSFTPSGTIGGSQTFSNVVTSSGGQNVGSAASPAVNVPGSITVNGSNFSFTGNSIGSGSSHNTIQPSIVVSYIIKT